MIEIEKGVPVPRKYFNFSKYPWHDMEVGDSFFIENPRKYKGQNAPISSHGNSRLKPKRFIQRKEGTGLRVWRIE